MKDLPKISVVVSTYGRWWLLNEMMQSFMDQDYEGPLELVIVDDSPCELIYNSQNPKRHVIIHNIEPGLSNPQKRDFGVNDASGDWVTFYDDDDCMMPHRFTSQIQRVQETGCDYLSCGVAWFLNYDKVSIEHNFFFCSHLWRRELYASCVTNHATFDDTGAGAMLRKNAKKIYTIPYDAKYRDIVHIYRWGGLESAHHSGISSNAGDAERIFKISTQKNIKFKKGPVVLNPHYSSKPSPPERIARFVGEEMI